MEFLVWHYGYGLNQYLHRWFYILGWVVHYFSLLQLLPSLFAPWKRLVDYEDTPGFNIQVAFRQLTFNLISRCMGAIVRTVLFIGGVLLLIPVFVVGLIGLAFWLACPLIGLPYFALSDPRQKRFFSHLADSMKADPKHAVKTALDNKAGKFVLRHTGLELLELVNNSRSFDLTLEGFSAKSYADIMYRLIDSAVWDRSYLRQKNADFEDLMLATRWWDSLARTGEPDSTPIRYSRPGIGLELLFGYTPILDQYSSDLGITQPFTHHLIGREELVSRIERVLTSSNSVILMGLPGVGKKTVILEFARRAMVGELGPKMVYKRVLELDYNFLLSQSLDLNQKKTSLSQILSEASQAGNVILVIKDIHRLTNPEVEGLDFTDLLEQHLERGKLKLIAISSQIDYERFVVTNSRLRKFLEPVEAVPPTKDQAMDILVDFASTWEIQKRLVIQAQALRAIIDGCDKYISDTPFPEKALEILDHVVGYMEKKDQAVVTPDDVNTVISETTGISLARLTQREKQLLVNLEAVLHQRLIGQDSAVSSIAKSLRARAVGAKSENRPLGSFLFLGPTGVGKTETAKTLAEVYFGSGEYLLRFDMAEYSGDEGLARLIGTMSKNLPGRLTTAIKNRPASLLLLDEIEKAPPEVYNLFLSLLDEGVITDAFGKQINCRHLFVIATSNAGSEYIRQLVSQNTPPGDMQKKVVEYVQKQGIFSPEFLNRFDGVVVFEPLQPDQLVRIAQLMLKDLVKSLDQKSISLIVAPEVAQKLATDGYEPEFGARPMRRLVDITVGDVIGRAILAEAVKPGDRVKLVPDDQEGYVLEKT